MLKMLPLTRAHKLAPDDARIDGGAENARCVEDRGTGLQFLYRLYSINHYSVHAFGRVGQSAKTKLLFHRTTKLDINLIMT
jgi:hypothetical protein